MLTVSPPLILGITLFLGTLSARVIPPHYTQQGRTLRQDNQLASRHSDAYELNWEDNIHAGNVNPLSQQGMMTLNYGDCELY